MTLHGHNDSFQEAAGLVNGLSASGYQELLNESGEVDRYMWPQTKALSEKWGGSGHPVLGPLPHEQFGPVGL